MPSIKCINCSHRIILPTPTSFCPNCGFPFSQSVPPGAAAMGGGGQAQAFAGGQAQALVAPSPVKQANTPLNPIIINTNIPSGGSANAPGAIGASIPGMPRRSPELEGVVLNMQTHQVSENALSGVRVIVMLRNILWPVANDIQYREERKITVTTVRLRTTNSDERDARMEGDIMHGSVNLGDTLSLWGRLRYGTLMVQKAYNHTAESQIRTKIVGGGGLAAVIVLAAILILMIVALWWYQQSGMLPTP